jgi:hypothetical protein
MVKKQWQPDNYGSFQLLVVGAEALKIRVI